MHFMARSRKHCPILTLHLAGLRIYNVKRLIVKNWNLVTWKWTQVPILE